MDLCNTDKEVMDMCSTCKAYNPGAIRQQTYSEAGEEESTGQEEIAGRLKWQQLDLNRRG